VGDLLHFAVNIEVETEEDGRFIAEVASIPEAMVYGATAKEAVSKVEALVLRIVADRIESGEDSPELAEVFTVTA
jgi:predicted RNase H-like HicB family nuclease